MKIIFVGGGTIGSVSPLLAIKDKLIEQKICSDFLWIGTEGGIEKQIIEKEKLPYFSVKCGKIRRYFSLKNFSAPFLTLFGVFQSLKIIWKYKPDAVLSAGSFVGVPAVIAARILRRKTFIHQQDIRPGLANKLCAPWATTVTVSFEQSKKYFSAAKTIVTGNPVREKIFNGRKDEAIKKFGLEADLPTLLIMGGSLGAEKLNELVFGAVPYLIDFCQIIHITGMGQIIDWEDKEKFGVRASRYHSIEYLYDDLVEAYAVADLVVCRSGMSTLTELAALKKAIVTIPIPDNQQEENAQYFDSKNAIVILDQEKTSSNDFFIIIKGLMENVNSLERLRDNIAPVMISEATKRYVDLLVSSLTAKK